ncbi:hypothetical protein BTHE68_40970 [Burkholderia sp. THE68]|nr:hypothetical protein BTHE68_40970 [Burkholderia sp. THE68]
MSLIGIEPRLKSVCAVAEWVLQSQELRVALERTGQVHLRRYLQLQDLNMSSFTGEPHAVPSDRVERRIFPDVDYQHVDDRALIGQLCPVNAAERLLNAGGAG